MKKIFVVAILAVSLCGCGKNMGDTIKNENLNKNVGESSPIHYMGDLSKPNGEVSFVLSDPTNKKGFVVGTYKFLNAKGEPIVESRG